MAKSVSKNGAKRGPPKPGGATTKVWVIGGIALFLVLLSSLAALAYFRAPPEDPKLADLRQLDGEIESLQKNEHLQPDDVLVIQALQVVREEKIDALNDQQHAVLQQRQEEQRDKWEQQHDERMSQRLSAFFAMPQSERLAAIDNLIEASEARLKAMEGNAAGGGPPGGGGAAPAGGPPGADGRAARGAAGGQRNGGSDRRSLGNSTPEQRKQRERSRLNRTTPEFRAQRTEFVRVVQERRKELGLQPASIRQLYGMYRQLAPPTTPKSGSQAPPSRS